MPLARISVPSHLSAPRTQALADAVHRGLVTTCGVPEEDRFQLISRFPVGTMILNPTFPDLQRTGEASVVEITFLAGRSDDQKRKLFRHVVDQAVSAGFNADDVMIALTENSPIDWSLGRGQAYADSNSHS